MADASGWMEAAAAAVFDPNLAFRPTVSVCILSHRPEYKAEAEASVRAQTLWPTGTVEIVSKECPEYWGNKINEVIAGSSGVLVVPLCDDDLLGEPTALEEWVRVFAEHPTVDFAYSNIWLFGGKDGDRELELPDWHPVVPTQRCCPWVTAMYRREVLTTTLYDRAGYDPALQYWDWDFSKRLGKTGKIGYRVPRCLFHAREHDQNGHKQMNHGVAFVKMWSKHDALEGPQPIRPEFGYPPYEEGRPSVLAGALLANAPKLPPVRLIA